MARNVVCSTDEMSKFRSGVVALHWYCFTISVLIVVLLSATGAHAKLSSVEGQVATPDSSIEKPGDSGVRAHTNIEIFRPKMPVTMAPRPPSATNR